MAITIAGEMNPEAPDVNVKDLEVKRSPNYRLAYANFAQAGMSTFDVRLTLSVIHETEPKNIGIEEEVTIVMPPPFAHAVAQLLMATLEKWQLKYNTPKQSDDTGEAAEAPASESESQ